MSDEVEKSPIEEMASGVTKVAPDVLVGTVGVIDGVSKVFGPTGDVRAVLEIVSTFVAGPGGKSTQHIVRAVVGSTVFTGRSSLKHGAPIRLMTPVARSSKRSAEMKARQKRAALPKAPVVQPVKPHVSSRLDVSLRDYVCWLARRNVVELLEVASPVDHQAYAAMKYKGTDDPSLEQRKEAYCFAFRALLDACYFRPGEL